MSPSDDLSNSPATPVTATVVTPPTTPPPAPAPTPIIIQTAPSRWGSLWTRIAWTGFIFCAIGLYSLSSRLSSYFDTSEGITEKYHSGSSSVLTKDKLAIITISGPILDGDGFAKKQIDRIRDDEDVKGVIVRIDSPGGSVSGSDYILHHLKKLREEKLADAENGKFPLVVSMGSMAASGGYYVAMAVGDQPQSIYAEPACTTGSIGVLMPHYDISGLLEKYDVKDDTLATHPRKIMLSMTKEMKPEERELAMNYINQAFARFKEIIKEGRPSFAKDSKALDELATGEIFTAAQAKKSGLIDEIGFIEEAIDRCIELGDLDKKKVRVVKYQSEPSLFDLSLMQSKSNTSALSAVMDFSTPRAYYLYTSLPVMLRAGK